MADNSLTFRPEAVAHATVHRTEGDVLRLSSEWTRALTFRLLVGLVLTALAYVVIGRLHDYGSGQAVVLMTGRSDLRAKRAATVRAIDVRLGEHVAQGAILVRFASEFEIAELNELRREIDGELAKTLRDPSDVAARAALASLIARRELATVHLEEFSPRAPRAGVVTDVRIRPGQVVGAGDVLVTLADEAAECSVLAMIPGQYRPRLQPGARLRFEVTGYRYAYQHLTVAEVGEEIVGPSEVQRHLGKEIADALDLRGPIELVRASLPACTFTVDGQPFQFHHGMTGTASVRAHSERIIFALVPAARALFGGSRE